MSGQPDHPFTDDGSDPGNCSVCHFNHRDPMLADPWRQQQPVVIAAAHYAETERRLMDDPIVRDMAEGVRQMNPADLAHGSGAPRHEFMLAANDEYRKRGGTDGGHLGAIASAILALLGQPGREP